MRRDHARDDAHDGENFGNWMVRTVVSSTLAPSLEHKIAMEQEGQLCQDSSACANSSIFHCTNIPRKTIQGGRWANRIACI